MALLLTLGGAAFTAPLSRAAELAAHSVAIRRTSRTRHAPPTSLLLFTNEDEDGPRFDLGIASQRPTEVVYGAAASASAEGLDEWCAHMCAEGMQRALALLPPADVTGRAADADAYVAALSLAGFIDVTVVDPTASGACAAAIGALRAAQTAKEKIVVHCAGGHEHTDVVMAAWLLEDYLGGQADVSEACDLLTAGKRKTRVTRRPDPTTLAAFMSVDYVAPIDDVANASVQR